MSFRKCTVAYWLLFAVSASAEESGAADAEPEIYFAGGMPDDSGVASDSNAPLAEDVHGSLPTVEAHNDSTEIDMAPIAPDINEQDSHGSVVVGHDIPDAGEDFNGERPEDADWNDPDKLHPFLAQWHKNDWFFTPWAEVQHLIPAVAGRILHVGCGNASWIKEMHDLGLDVLHTDKSAWMINKLKEDHPSEQFAVDDVMKMEQADASFGVVVDKAVLDAVGHIHDNPYDATTNEMYRVLKPGGIVLVVSMGPPLPYVAALNKKKWATRKIIMLDAARKVYYWRKPGGAIVDPESWVNPRFRRQRLLKKNEMKDAMPLEEAGTTDPLPAAGLKPEL